ncbi:ADP-ribosylation factor-like protein 9 [Scomber scombrus]|uniref:ADP-ribosylation factor-like protein 9 n=1 Tax=Scomber scombrus TaxID=13677 RepID=UPI002DDB6155|nr:ADP-ribosylation factor-like protein 9 [Scomber scombrus]
MSEWIRTFLRTVLEGLMNGLSYLFWDLLLYSFEMNKLQDLQQEAEGESDEEEGESDEEDREVQAEDRGPSMADGAQNAPMQLRPVASGRARVIVLGMDGAGKTSLLRGLASGCLERDTEPKEDLRTFAIDRDDLHMDFLEIGDKEALQPCWQTYMSTAELLMFVVDSSNPQLFPVTKKHLHELLASNPGLPLMVLANKQDLPGACSLMYLYDALSLSEIRDRRWFLFHTFVKETEMSSEVQKARDLLIQMVGDHK